MVRLPFTGSEEFAVRSAPMTATEVALLVVHVSTTGEPADVENGGLALNWLIVTEPTFTVALAETLPVGLVAVKVYVVVVVGLTVAQAFAPTLPTPPLMLMVVAPVTCQQSWED
jgi:hypothetical protein